MFVRLNWAKKLRLLLFSSAIFLDSRDTLTKGKLNFLFCYSLASWTNFFIQAEFLQRRSHVFMKIKSIYLYKRQKCRLSQQWRQFNENLCHRALSYETLSQYCLQTFCSFFITLRFSKRSSMFDAVSFSIKFSISATVAKQPTNYFAYQNS